MDTVNRIIQAIQVALGNYEDRKTHETRVAYLRQARELAKSLQSAINAQIARMA